ISSSSWLRSRTCVFETTTYETTTNVVSAFRRTGIEQSRRGELNGHRPRATDSRAGTARLRFVPCRRARRLAANPSGVRTMHAPAGAERRGTDHGGGNRRAENLRRAVSASTPGRAPRLPQPMAVQLALHERGGHWPTPTYGRQLLRAPCPR